MAHFKIRSHLRPWGRRYTFLLVAGNGEPLCSSEPYKSRFACESGILKLKELAAEAEIEDQTEDN